MAIPNATDTFSDLRLPCIGSSMIESDRSLNCLEIPLTSLPIIRAV